MVVPFVFTNSVVGRIICVRQKDGSEYWLPNPDPGMDPVFNSAHTMRLNQRVPSIFSALFLSVLTFNKEAKRNFEPLQKAVGLTTYGSWHQ